MRLTLKTARYQLTEEEISLKGFNLYYIMCVPLQQFWELIFSGDYLRKHQD